MRWLNAAPPSFGDTRECQGFLWFPRTIRLETRWLERARWKELFTYYAADGVNCWQGVEWLNVASEAASPLPSSAPERQPE